MLSFFHKDENISYVFQGLDRTPSKLPEDLPWVVTITKETLQRLLDDAVDDRLVMHAEKELDMAEEKSAARIARINQKPTINGEDNPPKHARAVSKIRALRGTYGYSFKKTANEILKEVDLEVIRKINRLYYVKIRGAFSCSLEKYLFYNPNGEEVRRVDVFRRILDRYVEAHPWRMENYDALQKFIFRLRDVWVGLTPDLQYVLEVSCPKFYALLDRDSVNYKNLSVTIDGRAVTVNLEANGFDRKLVEQYSGVMDFDVPVSEVLVEKPENVSLTFFDERWRSEALVFTPLIIEFFTFKPVKEIHVRNNGDLFEKNIFDLIRSHLCPSRERLEELIRYYFKETGEDRRKLFAEAVHTILYAKEGAVKTDFSVDVRRISEILTRYVQSG